MGIPILLNEKMLSLDRKVYIEWNPNQAAHAAICGNTGSGKTYFAKLFLGKVSLYEKDSQIYVCDFKGDEDFSFLNGCERFYRYNDCADGLENFYNRFQERQSGADTSRNMIFFLCDEWASYCNSISDDKKLLASEQRKLANLLMLGRSYNCHVTISQQRFDAQYFGSTRDNFNLCIGLSNLSESSKEMLFTEYKNEMLSDRKRGTGYMLTNGTNLQAVQVPTITDWDKLHETIKDGVTR